MFIMKNLILYLFFLALFFYGGVLYGSEPMLLIAFAGGIYAVLTYFFLAVRLWRIKAELVIPIPMVELGKETELLVKVKNVGAFPIGKIRCIVRYQNRLLKKGGRLVLSGTQAESGTEASQTVKGVHCGCVRYTLRRVRVYDLTGLFYLTKHCRKSAELNVIPPICKTSVVVTERARNFMGEAEVYDNEKAGPDVSEIFGVRPFRDGDRIQSIHWKMSAKTEELMVRENSLPLGCPVVVMFDAVRKSREMDSILTVAASVSCALIDQKCAHFMAWYDEKISDVVRMRIDEEEQLYQFLLAFYMEEGRETLGRKKPPADGIESLYREKYRMEQVVEKVRIDRNLELWVGDGLIRRMNGRKLARELEDVEIVV